MGAVWSAEGKVLGKVASIVGTYLRRVQGEAWAVSGPIEAGLTNGLVDGATNRASFEAISGGGNWSSMIAASVALPLKLHTRYGRKEKYVNLRNPNTRVSLFVRTNGREPFSYLGEVDHLTHREFVNKDRHTQQEYEFALRHIVSSDGPPPLPADFAGGRARRSACGRGAASRTCVPRGARIPRWRPALVATSVGRDPRTRLCRGTQSRRQSRV